MFDKNRLEIILGAQNEAEAELAKLKKQCADLADSVFSLNGVIAGLAGATGMAYLAQETLAATAEIERQANMAGTMAEAYQEISYAASKYQITQDALTDGLKELNLRAEEYVVAGAGPGKEAIERLGYSQEDLNDKLKDTPGLLLDVIDRMQGMERAAQMRIADEIFGGTGGEQFVAMIRGGSDSIREFTKELREMGGVLSNEAVSASKEAHNAINTLTTQVRTQFAVVVAELAPDIRTVSERMGDWVGQNRAFIAQNVSEVVTKTHDAVSKLKGLYDSLPSEIIGAAGYGLVGTMLFGWNVGRVVAAMALINDGMASLDMGLGDLAEKHYKSGQAIIKLWQSIADAISGKGTGPGESGQLSAVQAIKAYEAALKSLGDG